MSLCYQHPMCACTIRYLFEMRFLLAQDDSWPFCTKMSEQDTLTSLASDTYTAMTEHAHRSGHAID